jgi:protocatechuate 4,5-dioxygenase beta chain/2,3-dihydroxyphenylpropionate 1,2-dioxygenase
VGAIVAGCLTSHAPNITARPQIADPAQRERFVGALGAMRARLATARPDVLVVFANDHLQNFFYDNMPAFCVGMADRYLAPSKGGAEFLRIPLRELPGARAWGQALVGAAYEGGFDVAYSQELEFWDDVSVPLHFLDPDGRIPIVPVLVNCVAPPLPTPRRCHALGGFLRRFVESRPAAERVAVIGTGGISHWIGVPGHGRINPAFDRLVLDWIREGRHDLLTALTWEQIERDGGNGGQELRNWIAALGALPVKGEVLAYEPVTEWLTGSGAVWLPA